jgi:hypothetical protein
MQALEACEGAYLRAPRRGHLVKMVRISVASASHRALSRGNASVSSFRRKANC